MGWSPFLEGLAKNFLGGRSSLQHILLMEDSPTHSRRRLQINKVWKGPCRSSSKQVRLAPSLLSFWKSLKIWLSHQAQEGDQGDLEMASLLLLTSIPSYPLSIFNFLNRLFFKKNVYCFYHLVVSCPEISTEMDSHILYIGWMDQLERWMDQ